ncbi:PIN domain-containing protein [Bacillus sp. IITD106]|nr:PIN domain-containing protein [Bacillus sp. IITD106]
MRNNKYFIDASAFIALNDARDQYHAEARDIAATLKNNQLITSDAVINETYTILRYRIGFQRAYHFLNTVLAGDPFTIGNVTTPIRRAAFQMLEQYNDHNISYCDVLSVAMMKEQQIQKIFAFDYHFEIMGVQLIRV